MIFIKCFPDIYLTTSKNKLETEIINTQNQIKWQITSNTKRSFLMLQEQLDYCLLCMVQVMACVLLWDTWVRRLLFPDFSINGCTMQTECMMEKIQISTNKLSFFLLLVTHQYAWEHVWLEALNCSSQCSWASSGVTFLYFFLRSEYASCFICIPVLGL